MYEEERKKMVESLERRGYVKREEVKKAFLSVPREEFVPEKSKSRAYKDSPLPIGQGQTISAPSMIAIMLEELKVKNGEKVLEIGTGSGYNAALLAEIVSKDGKVYSIERKKEVAKKGENNLKKLDYEQVNVIIRDGTKGYSKKAPFDRILVTACAPKIPNPLKNQLNIGGRLAAPVGKHHMSQDLKIVDKIEKNKTKTQNKGRCAFVPLIGKHGWSEEEI